MGFKEIFKRRREPDEESLREKLITRAIMLSWALPKKDGPHAGLVFIKREMVSPNFLDSLSINGLGRLRLELKIEEEGHVTASIGTRNKRVTVSIEDDCGLFEEIIRIGEQAIYQQRLDGGTSSS